MTREASAEDDDLVKGGGPRAAPRLTIGIPVFNESENLPELVRRLDAVLTNLGGGPHEFLFIDDGSVDGSAEWIEEAATSDSRIRLVCFSRNFGHQAALTAAIDRAEGDALVLMDADLQDAPEAIPRFVDEYRRGFDVVYAIRVGRKEGPFLRSCYRLFYWLMARLSDTPLPEGSGDFGLLSRRAVEALRLHREQHRYLRGLRVLVGFRQLGIEVEREARHAGTSRYGFRGLVHLALNGLFAFSVVPIRLATLIGGFAIGGSLLYAIYVLWARLVLQQAPQGFTTLILAMVFLAGVQLLFLGIIGEYVGRIYQEAKGRPLYIVDRHIGWTETADTEPA
jgi:dolichol-phosphate mannosyltransferase